MFWNLHYNVPSSPWDKRSAELGQDAAWEAFLAQLPQHPYLPSNVAVALCSPEFPQGILFMSSPVGMGIYEIMPGTYQYRTYQGGNRVAEKDCVLLLNAHQESRSTVSLPYGQPFEFNISPHHSVVELSQHCGGYLYRTGSAGPTATPTPAPTPMPGLAGYCREWEAMMLEWIGQGNMFLDLRYGVRSFEWEQRYAELAPRTWEEFLAQLPEHRDLPHDLAVTHCATEFPIGILFMMNHVGMGVYELMPGTYQYRTYQGGNRVAEKDCVLLLNAHQESRSTVSLPYGQLFEFKLFPHHGMVEMSQHCGGYLYRIGNATPTATPTPVPTATPIPMATPVPSVRTPASYCREWEAMILEWIARGNRFWDYRITTPRYDWEIKSAALNPDTWEEFLAQLPQHPYLPADVAARHCWTGLPVGIMGSSGQVGMGVYEVMPGHYEYRTLDGDKRVMENDCVLGLNSSRSRITLPYGQPFKVRLFPHHGLVNLRSTCVGYLYRIGDAGPAPTPTPTSTPIPEPVKGCPEWEAALLDYISRGGEFHGWHFSMVSEVFEKYLASLPQHPHLPARMAYNLCSLAHPVGIVDDVYRDVGMGVHEIMPGLYEYRTVGGRYRVAGDIRVAEKDCVMDLVPVEGPRVKIPLPYDQQFQFRFVPGQRVSLKYRCGGRLYRIGD